ncbi:phosphoenolpyruvate--protein phosphotransferase [Spirochaeta africana]|uniref:Phosphoenolpyruvate-protein phosphotransferase n=1 Tax=Spirochaeta africana (strain ATCC 700263 / DSM 8902 / Z-7692) TaxID=889378 RepID=H9UKI0_SPIAZ|nr:phosphoenolpyruvate--protein phosphotransferase [Spirochaeta africana]AFG38023.1 phosphoenolpyruvate-protein phosphotransferase [Spirochaeta africana DSM 8902]
MKYEQEPETVLLQGIAVSPGIAIGKALVFSSLNSHIPQRDIEQSDVEAERQRFHAALAAAASELQAETRRLEKLGDSADQAAMLESHTLMLQDPELQDQVDKLLSIKLQNAEWIVHGVIQELINKLGRSQHTYLRERTSDLQDVERRILNHLMGRDLPNLHQLGEEQILVCDDLMPSDAIRMDTRNVLGVAMDQGGKTSHTAILTRAFEIPAVLGLSTVSDQANHGDTLILDGSTGTVILRPDARQLRDYQQRQRDWHRREVRLMRYTNLPAETRDGKLIFLKANIEIPEEVDSVLSHGADGVGLYRSEFLFLQSGSIPDEETQYRVYSQVLEALPGKTVTIRTLDIGGDKLFPGRFDHQDKNPILGWRAIRLCLSETDLFRTQLRALLRASAHGKLRIMFPMVSGIEELNQVLALYDSVVEELHREAVPMAAYIPVGIMIEIPSAAVVSDVLAKRVDFFSIGTNDLIQYTLAVDRGNERVAYLYEPFHPAVLRLLTTIIRNAHANGIPVAMCGEMAGDPLATLILLGLGLDEFSMGAAAIPEVKQILRNVTLLEAEELVGTIMDMKSHDEIQSYVAQLMEKRFDYRTNA